ncbi:hypothetical protein B0T11DRAFT_273616 [Plectosphaerella cucumerina]|uniref:Uncharacterized protein n=1 Tax=Plectosphaerella cucumerina TaxID=40658 RepID=A0A8K0X9R6_9PEZI|nr:hypothetical protein B0T11DRAFT_273616 [Plectosphaerella cucumerina]
MGRSLPSTVPSTTTAAAALPAVCIPAACILNRRRATPAFGSNSGIAQTPGAGMQARCPLLLRIEAGCILTPGLLYHVPVAAVLVARCIETPNTDNHLSHHNDLESGTMGLGKLTLLLGAVYAAKKFLQERELLLRHLDRTTEPWVDDNHDSYGSRRRSRSAYTPPRGSRRRSRNCDDRGSFRKAGTLPPLHCSTCE